MSNCPEILIVIHGKVLSGSVLYIEVWVCTKLTTL